MTINRKIIFGGVYLFIGFCIETSLGQVTCKTYTLVQLPGAMPTNGVTTQDTGKSDCETSCVNYASGGCYGFTWSNNICTLNTQSAEALYHNASSSVDYYNLIRAYSDCNAASTCSYVWSGVKNQHGSGATNANINNLSDCIKSCQGSTSCAAFDWNTVDKSCWIYTNAPTDLYPAEYLYFFRKNCTIQLTPTQQSLTTLPSTPPLLSSSTTTSSSSRIPSSSTTITTTTTTKPSSSSSSSSSSLKPSTLANQTSVSTTSTTVPTTTVSLCNGVKCNLGAECVGDKLNRTCVCVATCPPNNSPVCGSDNRTYTNDCELYKASCNANKTINLVRRGTCESGPGDQSGDGGGGGGGGEFAHYPAAIKPAYIVLAGLGGGCLLLVLTAVIILCEYPLRGAETYSSSGTLVNGRGGGYASQDIKMESAGGGGDGGDGGDGEGGGGEENVEFNPYYNRSELGAPDFTKEENIM